MYDSVGGVCGRVAASYVGMYVEVSGYVGYVVVRVAVVWLRVCITELFV